MEKEANCAVERDRAEYDDKYIAHDLLIEAVRLGIRCAIISAQKAQALQQAHVCQSKPE